MIPTAATPVPPSPSGRKAFRAGLITACAGLLVGLDTGLISQALGFIGMDFRASTRDQEWIVSVLMLGASVGSLGAGTFSARFGRRTVLTAAMVLMFAGACLCANAMEIPQILTGRLLIGVAIGICTFTAPLYISETMSGHLRGSMVSTFSMLQSAGILAGYLAGGILSSGGHWRWMVSMPMLPAALLFIGCFLLPPSPSWLIARGQDAKARTVLRALRDTPAEADAEFASIKAETGKGRTSGLKLLRQQPNFRRSVMLGICLQVMQQLTGINVVMYYTPKILQNAHFGTSGAAWATVLIGVINTVVGIAAIFLVNRWGRRPLLCASAAIMAVSLAVAAVITGLHLSSIAATLCLLAALLTFVGGFGLGAGPLVWTLCSEIQPLEGRDFGVGCSTLANWWADWIVSNTFLSIVSVIGFGQTFAGFALMNVVFIVFTLMFVPETRDVPLETIETNLLSGKKLRNIGR
ncbi:sugar porter family MFS transporter [Gluconacetobacter entanii]|uniref:Sugar porter family MFS transporter n=1 Tax=Gluconacetobacter entanii TaxID=108528 RepID=A0ABT3K3Y1_9PROT|nr:sugar porter family MFS transporter [Gluconacetobacter entanii]MCW4590110.1 sugar porter family MFS transporter [Gluconacetobacter entanii]MCW4594725.1 sugar porter family MFS transporter [Gluconacetobacter entanii]NPC89306.1 sugar porter family MFS transporter [Gluconacetobacter entanii]